MKPTNSSPLDGNLTCVRASADTPTRFLKQRVVGSKYDLGSIFRMRGRALRVQVFSLPAPRGRVRAGLLHREWELPPGGQFIHTDLGQPLDSPVASAIRRHQP